MARPLRFDTYIEAGQHLQDREKSACDWASRLRQDWQS